MTIYYGCTVFPGVTLPKLPNLFSCITDGITTASYFVITGAGEMPDFAGCSGSVVVHVNQAVAQGLMSALPSINITEALDSGFGLRWNADDTICSGCVQSGGVCGSGSGYALLACAPIRRIRLRVTRLEADLDANNTVKSYCVVFRYDCLKPCLLLLSSPSSSPPPSHHPPRLRPCFRLGSLQNITYPFTGGARPAYCGLPEFQLTCLNNTHTELTTDSVTYRVLSINQTLKTLTLAPSEFYKPPALPNSLTPPRFHRLASGRKPRPHFKLRVFLAVAGKLHVIARCTVTVAVKLNGDAAGRLTGNRTTLREALMSGFNVSYSDPYEHQCSNCSWVGGRCGFDSSSSLPICICGDVQCAIPTITLSNESGTSSSKNSPQAPKNIVLFIAGAVVAGVGLGWGIFACKQRRRKRLSAQSSLSAGLSAGTKSKEISPPTMSRGLAMAPSAYFTQSIPSYPSSKFSSDIENASTYFGAQVFDYTELEEVTGNFDRSRELGDGGFGTVYYVKRLYENNFKRVEQFMNEVEILTRLRHVNLVKLYGCTSKRSRELLLVYEYIPNGTVADHLMEDGQILKSDVYSFGVVLIELISSKQAVDTNRDRHDINLSNMAVNKIQNHALHELVDPSLGFEANNSVRRMITLVAELAFRCLQTERDMRPSMGEVLEALRGIKNGLNAQKPEVVDIVTEDEVGLLKGGLPPTSPDSEKKWVRSNSSTPNSSG
ncbi:hypothetical protein C3L33_18631, partial [Rhododendron williamsianum]